MWVAAVEDDKPFGAYAEEAILNLEKRSLREAILNLENIVFITDNNRPQPQHITISKC